jgi:hypothetical protein|tara:strand:+ start:1682 stop:2536 length:855 start_codon:yes stop_codon:yes gene_type:complete
MPPSPTYTEEVVYPEVTVYQSAEQIPSFSNLSHKAESRFDKLQDEVAREYEKKGYSNKEAMKIGGAVAYDAGVKKYGKAGMERLAREGRRDKRGAESKFDKLSDKIAKQYEKKGMSAKKAKEIGKKTAYTIGARKYGKAGMARKARRGMRAESFEAQGNPDKRTTTQYAKFYVGFEDDEGELRGGGKFKKYDDALAQADIVSEREGNSRIVTTRGFALWTDDGKGMWQDGYDKKVAKEFYSAEGYTIGSGFRLGFGLGLGMLALSTATTILAIAVSKVDERQVE